MQFDDQLVLNFMQKQHEMVQASNGPDGQPQAAIIGLAVLSDFRVVFGTNTTSRKYKNLQQDPRLSLVLGWAEGITVQYEGRAKLLEGSEAEQYKAEYLKHNPSAAKYADESGQTYILVTPNWIRYTDTKQSPEFVVEKRFGS